MLLQRLNCSAKYSVKDERLNSPSNYETNTTLTIHDIQPEDIQSSYICVAVNYMGQAEASIQFYGSTAYISFHVIHLIIRNYETGMAEIIQTPNIGHPNVSSQHSNINLIDKDEDNSVVFRAGN